MRIFNLYLCKPVCVSQIMRLFCHISICSTCLFSAVFSIMLLSHAYLPICTFLHMHNISSSFFAPLYSLFLKLIDNIYNLVLSGGSYVNSAAGVTVSGAINASAVISDLSTSSVASLASNESPPPPPTSAGKRRSRTSR